MNEHEAIAQLVQREREILTLVQGDKLEREIAFASRHYAIDDVRWEPLRDALREHNLARSSIGMERL